MKKLWVSRFVNPDFTLTQHGRVNVRGYFQHNPLSNNRVYISNESKLINKQIRKNKLKYHAVSGCPGGLGV